MTKNREKTTGLTIVTNEDLWQVLERVDLDRIHQVVPDWAVEIIVLAAEKREMEIYRSALRQTLFQIGQLQRLYVCQMYFSGSALYYTADERVTDMPISLSPGEEPEELWNMSTSSVMAALIYNRNRMLQELRRTLEKVSELELAISEILSDIDTNARIELFQLLSQRQFWLNRLVGVDWDEPEISLIQ